MITIKNHIHRSHCTVSFEFKMHRTPWIFINSVFLINSSIHIPVGCKLSSDKWLSRPSPDSCSYQWFYGRNHNHIVIPGTSRLAFHFNPKSSPVNLTPWPFCIFPARVQLPCKFASLMCYTFYFFSLSLFFARWRHNISNHFTSPWGNYKNWHFVCTIARIYISCIIQSPLWGYFVGKLKYIVCFHCLLALKFSGFLFYNVHVFQYFPMNSFWKINRRWMQVNVHLRIRFGTCSKTRLRSKWLQRQDKW